MEIPILIRILRSQEALRLAVSNVLALDYLGALIASLAFPLLLVPYLGLLHTSFLFGFTLFTFPKDTLSNSDVRANRLDDQMIVRYYRNGWKRFNQ